MAALARFVVTILFGTSTEARDGATGADLQKVARIAMLGWESRIGAGG